MVAGAVAGGVRWVVLREKGLPRAERAALAAELRPILAEAGGTLVVAGPDPLGGDAVHLPAAGPYPPPRRDPTGHAPTDPADRPAPTRAEPVYRAGPADRPGCPGPADHSGPAGRARPWLVGRSCHDAAELARLTTEDYAILSPVYPSRSKPGYGPPLGTLRLGALIRFSPVPVLALGGIETPDQVRACLTAGAAGVAVQGAIMRAGDPAGAAAALTTAWAEAAALTTDWPEVAALTTARAEGRSRHPHAETQGTGLRPTVPTQGSSLTARSGHGRPQPSTAPTDTTPTAPAATVPATTSTTPTATTPTDRASEATR
ncbi:thiamine-phosphate pyrophosphorylase [Micromonospora carbonacea]|uniref:Thiamine-phosphate pyrophosphorylase n=1 Tax=Micromonospora carbonacea TaxID=47853 RepID=A0A1C4UGT3_9ACTN|nr:thiamine-phosphate pyrophosphorylase [Micromonospora carbonacea]